MPWPYMYISSSPDHATIFPCDRQELKYALRNATEDKYRENWPGHGHGPEWRVRDERSDYGVMVLDLRKIGAPAMSLAELKVEELWPPEREPEPEPEFEMVQCPNKAAHRVGDAQPSMRMNADGTGHCYTCGFKGSVPK